jgi:hypothetical protein
MDMISLIPLFSIFFDLDIIPNKDRWDQKFYLRFPIFSKYLDQT